VADLIVVDTDILIDAGRGVSEALVYLHQIEQQSSLATSAVTQMELIIVCTRDGPLRSHRWSWLN
jgi:predicted nucleic acid-binding protein